MHLSLLLVQLHETSLMLTVTGCGDSQPALHVVLSPRTLLFLAQNSNLGYPALNFL